MTLSLKGKTVVLCSNTSWSIYNFRSGLIRYLLGNGVRVIALAPEDEFSENIRDIGAEFVAIDLSSDGINPIIDLKFMLRLALELRPLTPDLVINYTIKPVIYGALVARLLRVKVMSVVPGLGSVFLGGAALRFFVTMMYRVTQLRVRKIFLLNYDDYGFFVKERLAPSYLLDVLPGEGVDIQKFFPPKQGFIALRKSLDTKFLFVGRLIADKGVLEFVEAARLIRKVRADVKFQILGYLDVKNPSAISRSLFEGWISEGVVEYLGDVSDVRPILASADVVVLPSYREGLSRSLLEAAAMGKPIISTKIAGCKEIVDHGRTGYLCTPRDVAELQSAITTMADLSFDERYEMGLRGREKVEREFSETKVIEKYSAVFETLM